MKRPTDMQKFSSTARGLGKSLLCLAALSLLPIMAKAKAVEDLALIKVTSPGLYRISYEDLLAQGFPPSLQGLSHRQLTVRLDGQQLPVNSIGRVVGNKFSNKFGPGGYLEFFVPAVGSLYSAESVLVLRAEQRTATVAKQRSRFNSEDAASTTYTHVLELEQNNVYDFFSPAHNDPWHYGTVYSFGSSDVQGTTVPFTLDNLVGSSADLSAEFIGIVDIDVEGNDHHVVGVVNGVEVGDEQFDGNVVQAVRFANVNVQAANTFRFDIRSIATTPYDAVALNRLTVEYPRSTQTSDDYLDGVFAANQVYEVSGFSNNNVDVFAIGADGQVEEVILTEFPREGVVKFKTNGQGGRHIVVADSGHKTPAAIQAFPVFADVSSGSAEYLIIAHGDFIGTPALDALVGLRSATYSVKVVDVAELYHQFSDLHVPSAQAINNYIRFAEQNLGTRFVLFVGGDTYDYKNYKSAAKSFVPTQYVETRGDGLIIRQAPSDAKYGDLDDDGVPDLPVGRFPVRTEAELSNIVEKINDYEARVGYPGRVLMVADQADNGNGVNFTKDAIALIEGIPPQWAGSIRSDYRALPDLDGAVEARSKLFNAVNAGVSVTAYIGHSSQLRWSRTTPALLSREEVASFTNIDKPTLVTQWGCWNTYFVHPDGNSMGELFLNPGLNGAATVLGASTLTKAASEFLLASELNKHMYNEGEPIGAAVIKAKQALALIEPSASDVLLGWQILGDPALVINH